MELNSLIYFSELAKDLNMTRTAERLFLSQQSLSYHLLRLEEELGARLFERKPSLKLTAAGEQFLNYSRTAAREFENLKNRISDIEKQDRGVIRFGASTLRLSSCLPAILPQFHERYPDVEIRITDSISRQLVPRVIRGELDMAITLTGEEIPVLTAAPLMEDNLYLCVSDGLLQKYFGSESDRIKAKSSRRASIRDFGELPFCLYNNRLGDLIRGLFEEANIIPKATISSTYTQIGFDLCMRGVVACVATQLNLAGLKEIPPDINIFPLYHPGKPVTHPVQLIWRSDRYLSAFSQYFIELLTAYFSEVAQQNVGRIARESL